MKEISINVSLNRYVKTFKIYKFKMNRNSEELKFTWA